jgi:hypothetical protein
MPHLMNSSFMSESEIVRAPCEPDPAQPDALAGFPSEVPLLLPPAAPRVISPIVRPSAMDRERFMDRPRSMRIPLKRLAAATNPLLGLLAVALIVVSIIRDQSIGSFRDSESAEPLAVADAPSSTPALPGQPASFSTLAATPQPPTDQPQPLTSALPRDAEAAAARRADATLARTAPDTRSGDASRPKSPKTASRSRPPAATPAPPPPSVPNWALVSTLVRPASSSSITPIDNFSVRTDVAPPPSLPPAPTPTAAPAPSASPTTARATGSSSASVPAPSAPAGTSATAARTASVQSVIDRFREAFDTLDASSVAGFWPSVDSRALSRAFAQLDSQQLHFERCDIQLAGTRAFASCHGYVQLVRKAGSQDPRTESRKWTFTLGEVKDHWVILGVDARQER